MAGISNGFGRSGLIATLVLLVAILAPAVRAGATELRHGIAMHGEPALAEGFTHYPHVRADAPKGGRLTLGAQGTFDSLNPFIVRGVSAQGLRGYVYESMLSRAPDEPFTLYGLIADKIEVAADRSAITFHLAPAARFSDGKPITAADVLFSHALLREKGQPFMRSFYGKVLTAEALAADRVRFTFEAGADREIPLILGLMPILPKHALDPATFDQTTLATPIGSGPYVIEKHEPGRFIHYRRDPNYWAAERPTRRGQFNFDEVHFEYFRDANAKFEAFKAGAIDVRVESDPGQWVEGYGFPAARDGRVILRTDLLRFPAGMAAFVPNSRRPPFDDQRVREALIRLFDFNWVNRSLYHARYQRTESWFARSNLAAVGQAATAAERAVLGPHLASIPPEILDGTWRLATSDGTGSDRTQMRAALSELQAAGFRLDGRRLVHTATGKPFAFEFLARTKEQERLALAYGQTLARLGIEMTIRQVDDAQYWRRTRAFDFDMMQWTWPNSLSPGNEQLNRVATRSADIEGSLNFAGVRSEAVDAMLQAMLRATTAEEFATAVRAYDRALMAGAWVIPLFHLPEVWTAHWARVAGPASVPLLGNDLDTWWVVGR